MTSDLCEILLNWHCVKTCHTPVSLLQSEHPLLPRLPHYLIVTLCYTKPREQGNLPKLGGISVKPKGDTFD